MNWTNATIEQRREFIKNASSTVGIAVCSAFFLACESTTVKAPTDTNPTDAITFIITADEKLKSLTTINSSVFKTVPNFNSGFPVLFFRTSQTEILAYSSVCPHQSLPINETLEGNKITCSWHGSQFEVQTGNVIEGPANGPLLKFVTTFDPQTNVLTLK